MKLSGGSLILSASMALLVENCVALDPNRDGPAWYCTGTAIVGEVRGVSTANLNADGTVFQVMREWNWPSPPRKPPRPLSVTGLNDEVWISVPGAPKDYYKNTDRIEIRLDSVSNPQDDPSLARDEPHNGSNAYVFSRNAFNSHKSQRAFFVALQRDRRVWWFVPFDLSILDQGEHAVELADAPLAAKRADFKKRCLPREKVQGLVVI